MKPDGSDIKRLTDSPIRIYGDGIHQTESRLLLLAIVMGMLKSTLLMQMELNYDV